MTQLKVYTGKNSGIGGQTVTVGIAHTEGKSPDRDVESSSYLLPLAPSLSLRNHSPDGFQRGFGGSGPAQLALAVLLDFSHSDEALSLNLYQQFKQEFLVNANQRLVISELEILAWMRKA